MDGAIQLLPEPGAGRQTPAGFHHQRVQGAGKRGELQQRGLEVQGLRLDLLEFDAFGCFQSYIPRDEPAEFLGFGLLFEPIECIRGEVCEGLALNLIAISGGIMYKFQ